MPIVHEHYTTGADPSVNLRSWKEARSSAWGRPKLGPLVGYGKAETIQFLFLSLSTNPLPHCHDSVSFAVSNINRGAVYVKIICLHVVIM